MQSIGWVGIALNMEQPLCLQAEIEKKYLEDIN
jgi:hypothetical protein